MLVKARELKVGQWIKCGSGWEAISAIQEYPSGVMIFYTSQVGNPFVASTFGSYSLDTLVEVDGNPE